MYCKHFGFEESPFGVTPDPRFFYGDTVTEEALADLKHGIELRKSFIVVTGEAGTGKTTLLRRLISTSVNTIKYGFITNPSLSFTALLRKILKDWGIPSPLKDRKVLLEQLHGYVREQSTAGHTFALFFDEAQALSDEVLEELRLLYEIGCDDNEKLIPIVLVGQPVLDARLDESNLSRIKECITLRRRLMPLQDRDVGLYVKSRLECVGYHRDDLFAPDAIARLVDRSSGIPRLINTICDNALLLAYRASKHRVTAAMIDEVANQPGFVAPSSSADLKTAQENDQPVKAEIALSTESVETSHRVDDFEKEIGEQVIPATEEDSWALIDEQKAAPENDQPENIEDHYARESNVQSLVDETATERKHLRNDRVAEFSRMRISIGALMVLVALGWGLVAFNPWGHKAVTPAIDSQVANSLSATRPVVVVEKPIEEIGAEIEISLPASTSPPHSSPIPKNTARNDVGVQKQMVERENARNIVQPRRQQIYRVTAASFLRSRPAADAEIIETLQPGTRIAVARSGEYFRVRSLADDRISGFMHKEDAFFELIP